MDINELFDLWRIGFAYGLQITLYACFIPAALSAVWTIWNIAR